MGSLARRMARKDIIPKSTRQKVYERGMRRGVANVQAQTKDALTDAYNRGFDEANMKAHIFMAVCAMAVLHDKFGFGKDRGKRFIAELENLTDSVNRGYVKTGELMQMLVDDGLDFCGTAMVDDGHGRSIKVSAKELLQSYDR